MLCLTRFVPPAWMQQHFFSVMPYVLAASLHTQPPVELFLEQVPLFADSLQHGAILLGPTQQIGERVVYGTVWH